MSMPERKTSILVVDDSPSQLKVLSRLLGDRGYSVTAVQDGEQAFEQALKNVPDLVLSDVLMPGIDGFALCRRLLAQAETAHVPVILMSQDGSMEAIRRGLLSGARDFLSKKKDKTDQLFSAIEAALPRDQSGVPGAVPGDLAQATAALASSPEASGSPQGPQPHGSRSAPAAPSDPGAVVSPPPGGLPSPLAPHSGPTPGQSVSRQAGSKFFFTWKSFDSVCFGVAILNLKCQLLYANPIGKEFFGLRADQFVKEADRKTIEPILQRVLATAEDADPGDEFQAENSEDFLFRIRVDRICKSRDEIAGFLLFLWPRRGADALAGLVDADEDPGSLVESATRLVQQGRREEGLQLLRGAAAKGDAYAQYKLGSLLEKGIGMSVNVAEAAKWYRKSAEAGHPKGQFMLADLYFRGDGVTQDLAESARWFRKSADQGFPSAQYRLGCLFESGQGVTKYFTEALRWYQKAAELGHEGAMYNLGVIHDTGRGVSRMPAEAAKWYRAAADHGYGPAMYNLAVMYDAGEGVPKSLHEAERWYTEAAALGYALAQYNLGTMYELAENPDYPQSAHWYRLAADQGLPEALHALGRLHDLGRGVDRDLRMTLHLFQSAAQAGYAEAQYDLGLLYATGQGVAVNYQEAALWIQMAAEQGHTSAMNNLGKLYLEGLGVARDEEQGHYWIARAGKSIREG